MAMKVNEVFVSVQGEGTHAGLPCTFVRFTACDLRCTYCDTAYAFYEGSPRPVSELLDDVSGRGVPLVCVTGGEPMLQREILPFLRGLVSRGHEVLLETGGHRPLSDVPPEVIKIVDIKTPGATREATPPGLQRSPADTCFDPTNLAALRPHDEVKVVLTDRADYEWARAFLRDHDIYGKVAQVLLSPSHGQLDPRDLVAWILEDRLPVRLNLQLHKYVWGAEVRGV